MNDNKNFFSNRITSENPLDKEQNFFAESVTIIIYFNFNFMDIERAIIIK